MALQKGLEANRRHLQINILPSFDLKRLSTMNVESNSTIYLHDFDLRSARLEETILVEDDTALDNVQEQK